MAKKTKTKKPLTQYAKKKDLAEYISNLQQLHKLQGALLNNLQKRIKALSARACCPNHWGAYVIF
ncbi:hypothetical protein LCGC14_2084400 [marine sediment metagenome]|uniref:Uncharacterized protein n=1 Tax=marine sediment metagenome TaxID=412755 RepID=A0A0F9EEH3_9ZZZZ